MHAGREVQPNAAPLIAAMQAKEYRLPHRIDGNHYSLYVRHILMKEAIHISYTADANYGPCTGISMASIILTNPSSRFHFHLFSDGVRRRDLKRMRKMMDDSGNRLSIYNIKQQFDQAGLLSRHPCRSITRASYGCLFLDVLMPDSLEHILYLDGDTICLGSLTELWDLCGQMKSVMMVKSGDDEYFDKYWLTFKQRTGLPLDAPNYGSGVMLINLSAWRQQKMSEKFMAFVKQHPQVRVFDQDVISAVLGVDIQPLDMRWSTPDPAIGRILHYTGGGKPPKPWQWGFKGLGAEQFLAVKRVSPWRYTLPEFSIQRTLRRLSNSVAKRIQKPAA